DVGDDINLASIEKMTTVKTVPLALPKYFKNYHRPLTIEIPNTGESPQCISCKIHNFGAVSFTYKIPFKGTLEDIQKDITALDFTYYEQSSVDIKAVFSLIKDHINKPYFYQTRSSYSVIQINPEPEAISITSLKELYGGIIASTLRFESKTLAEYQKNDLLESAIGYFRGDLIIVDTYATFLYDAEYEELLDFFEFANIQQLELRYYDRVLDQQLNLIYEGQVGKPPMSAYFPFIGLFTTDSVFALGKLKADISVVTERLEDSVKLAGEPYYSELYTLLMEKLDIKNWNSAIDRKLEIIKDVQTIYQHKVDAIREHILTILITILIFIELIVGIFSYFK
ncbi:MAG: hypothetical protein NTX86_04685, partial [Candidatus Dependentiae bacterium]|nr:hypothetical protein [Candidatus Dependentiae bacterium]